jgi:glycosyltransferase involved in cell wall biosynthesis
MATEISLVICTYNRCRYLPEALHSIRAQNIKAARFELIIVDNNSTDDTARISQEFIAANPQLNIRYCFEENKGLSFARNRGIKESSSGIVNYVDDDAILSVGYLEAMLLFFRNNPQAIGAGGKVIPKYEAGSEPEWMSKYLNGFIGKIDFGSQVKIFSSEMKYPVGCNMAYKKESLLKAGGFNNALQFRSDDKYIFYQLRKQSDQVYFVPDAWLFHYIDAHRLDPENFKKLFLKTGNEERKRVMGEEGKMGVIKKGLEFLIKSTASLLLLLLFSLKGQYEKGKYVFISQYYTLKGFFKKEVFVR